MSRDSHATPGLESIEEDDSSEVTMRLPIRRSASVAPPRTPTLRVRAGRHMLQFATIRPGEPIIIGRDESADLRIPDLTVSKRHARVEAVGGGNVRLQDLGSTNGTTLDGSAIETVQLRPGDQIEVGAIGLRLDLLNEDELRHLARVVTRLESANRDALTGLLNRVWMDEELPSLVERYDRGSLPLTCAFVDIDNFKRVNDTFSHAVGDEALSAIARLLMLGLRDADPCVRYGGEEILLFLPGSDEADAIEACERIRASIAAHDWGRTAPGLAVTASIGVAERVRGESIRDWVDRADAALYAAKRAGRNRVFRARPPA